MTASDREEIRRVFEEIYPENVRTENFEGYGDMYARDALWMPPDAPDRRGREDILEGFAAMIEKNRIDPVFTAEEIEVIGDFGYAIGRSNATIHPKDGGEPKKAIFRAVFFMKKEKNIWKIDRQIWNVKPQ